MSQEFNVDELEDAFDEEEVMEEQDSTQEMHQSYYPHGSKKTIGDEILTIKEMVFQVRSDVRRMKKEVEEYQREALQFQQSVVDMLQHLLAKTPGFSQSFHSQSQSLMAPPKETPFVTITFKDGTKKEEHVPLIAQNDWAKSSSTQELTRKVLLFLYNFDVAKLRLRRITERACDVSSSNPMASSVDSQGHSQSGSMDEVKSPGPVKEPLEERDILFVLEVVRKLEKPEEDERKFVSRVRKAIRESINYLYNYYGPDGNKLPQKSFKKAKVI